MAWLVFSYPRLGVREGSGSWMRHWGDCGVWACLQNLKGPGFKYQLKAIRGKTGSATAARSSVVLWPNSLSLCFSGSLLSHFYALASVACFPLLFLLLLTESNTHTHKPQHILNTKPKVHVCLCVCGGTHNSCVCIYVLVRVCVCRYVGWGHWEDKWDKNNGRSPVRPQQIEHCTSVRTFQLGTFMSDNASVCVIVCIFISAVSQKCQRETNLRYFASGHLDKLPSCLLCPEPSEMPATNKGLKCFFFFWKACGLNFPSLILV